MTYRSRDQRTVAIGRASSIKAVEGSGIVTPVTSSLPVLNPSFFSSSGNLIQLFNTNMRFLIVAAVVIAVAYAQEAAGPPEVNWGKCPQLEPSDDEQRSKGEVIEQCLQKNPPPQGDSLTQEQVDAHRETITTCALKTEGWFNADGGYKFERAKKEIEGKNLKVSREILSKHDECTSEAKENFPERNIQQVQLYQACMDFHITKICDIKITPPTAATQA